VIRATDLQGFAAVANAHNWIGQLIEYSSLKIAK
jgi:hypothetical protein